MKTAANEIIKAKRLELGWSQKQLAEKAELSHNTIYNLEANKVTPDIATYTKICKALKINLSSLLLNPEEE